MPPLFFRLPAFEFAVTAAGIPPIDLLLIMAAKENDVDKIKELIQAGANLRITDAVSERGGAQAGQGPRSLACELLCFQICIFFSALACCRARG